MTDDIIERAENLLRTQRLQSDSYAGAAECISKLVAALKAARAELEQLRSSLQYQAPKAWDGKEPWPGDAVREAWKDTKEYVDGVALEHIDRSVRHLYEKEA